MMWRSTTILLGVILFGITVPLNTVWAKQRVIGLAEAQEIFVHAKQAYDENRLDEAISNYHRLADQGYQSKELLFNLGNTYYRLGQPGLAVLNYRRAWRYSPRDPDIEANMNFALQQTGAPAPTLPRLQNAFLQLNEQQWKKAAIATYWLLGFIISCHFLLRSRTYFFSKLTTLLSVVFVVALIGLWQWHKFSVNSEWVVTQANQKALFAPIDASTEHFSVPEGSIVKSGETSEEWVKILFKEKEGWIRKSACEKVFSSKGEI